MKFKKSKEAKKSDGLGFSQAIPSGIYSSTITEAFMGQSTKGSGFLKLSLKTPEGAVENITLWITDAEGNTFNTYNGVVREKRGFTIANSIAMILTKKGIDNQKTEDKEIKQNKTKVKVEYLPKWKGKKLLTAIQRIIENGQEKVTKKGKTLYVKSEKKYSNNYLKEVFLLNKSTIQEKETKVKGHPAYDRYKELMAQGDLDSYEKVKGGKKKKGKKK